MSTATCCDWPLRNFHNSAAASPVAATAACAAAATRKDDGSCGSSPERMRLSSAPRSPPTELQRSARILRGVCMKASLRDRQRERLHHYHEHAKTRRSL